MVKPVNPAKTNQTTKRHKQSTVMILDAKRTKTLTVNTRLLRAIRPLLWCLSILTVLLTGGLSVLGYQYYQNTQTTTELKQEVNQLKNLTSAEIEAKLSALKASETTVSQLQQYLKSKGVTVKPVDYHTRTQVPPNTSAGAEPIANNHSDSDVVGAQALDEAHAHAHSHHSVGGPELKLSAPIPFVGDFSEQADELLDVARTVPLGRPHSGELSSRFGIRRNPFTKRGGEMHGGLDFRGKTGEPIYTTADGVVDFAGVQRGYGNVVIVKHAHGYKTYYAHLSAIDVTKGQRVQSGDQVGKLGSTGRSTGPHLHYEVRLNNERLDPEHFLSIENTEPSA